MRTIFFHEDDYCQQEILPLTAKDFCLYQMGGIDAFAEEHKEGDFFTDTYIRQESRHTISELNLTLEKLEEALCFLPVFDRIETGYSNYSEECKTIQARGFYQELAVFWELDEKGFLKTAWLDIWVKPENQKLCYQVLSSLGKMAPVLLADWCWGCCVNLTNPKDIDCYIQEKLNDE